MKNTVVVVVAKFLYAPESTTVPLTCAPASGPASETLSTFVSRLEPSASSTVSFANTSFKEISHMLDFSFHLWEDVVEDLLVNFPIEGIPLFDALRLAKFLAHSHRSILIGTVLKHALNGNYSSLAFKRKI